MIIANGFLYEAIKQGGGIDPNTGHPVAPSVAYSDNRRRVCQYVRRRDLTATDRNGNPITKASYDVYLAGVYEGVENVRLTDMNGSIICDASCVSIEYLRAVDETHIVI